MLILSGCSLVIFDTGIMGRRFPEIGDSGIARLRLNIVRSMLSSKFPSVLFLFLQSIMCSSRFTAAVWLSDDDTSWHRHCCRHRPHRR